tara:strand:+ start:305 stop:478 length:174 start_codon:yes stop_codon:yes gene_type:complete
MLISVFIVVLPWGQELAMGMEIHHPRLTIQPNVCYWCIVFLAGGLSTTGSDRNSFPS